MTQRACRACGEWHETAEPWPRACAAHFRPRGPRSNLSAPYIRTDGMEAILSHADGQMYDSKSQYYAAVKAKGCEIVGNDSSVMDGQRSTPGVDESQIERDVVDTMKQAGML